MSRYLVSLDLLGEGNLLVGATVGFFPRTEAKACQAGREDADRETSGVGYFLLGLTTFYIGPMLAYSITPSVPEEKLKGKDALYVSSYTECYEDEAQSIHVKWAWFGVLALGLLCGIAYGLVMLGNTGTD